jgi:hypothetical protein
MAVSVSVFNKTTLATYLTFSAWLAAVSTSKSIIIATDVEILGSVVVPSTIDIVGFRNNAKFTGSGSITINKMSANPAHQIFDSTLASVSLSGAVKPVWFGAWLTSDDTAPVQRAVNSSQTINLDGRGYTILSQITVGQGKYIYNGEFDSTSNTTILSLAKNCIVENVNFVGSGKDSGNTLQRGIMMNGGAGYDLSSNNMIKSCKFRDFGGSGIALSRIVASYLGNKIESCSFTSNNYGIDFMERGEYTTVSNCLLSMNNVGYMIVGGNNTITGGCCTNNVYGIHVANGENDSHGTISNMLINHNTYPILVDPLQSEQFTFLGCKIYYGRIYLNQCVGVVFESCLIDVTTEIYEDGATSCFFNNCQFTSKDVVIVQNYLHPSNVMYYNCQWGNVVLLTKNNNSNGYIYLYGDASTDGSIRKYNTSTQIITQLRISGAWTTVETISNSGSIITRLGVGMYNVTPPATQPAHIADAANAAGATPTKAEFDALVTKFNTVLTRMESFGMQPTS